MAAQLTAIDVLVLVLAFSFIGALAGWAGGWGARLTFSLRLARAEAALMQVLNRAKGAAGQEQTKVQRTRVLNAEQEAEQLARELAQRGPKERPIRPLTEADLPRIAAERGLIMSGNGEGERTG